MCLQKYLQRCSDIVPIGGSLKKSLHTLCMCNAMHIMNQKHEQYISLKLLQQTGRVQQVQLLIIEMLMMNYTVKAEADPEVFRKLQDWFRDKQLFRITGGSGDLITHN